MLPSPIIVSIKLLVVICNMITWVPVRRRLSLIGEKKLDLYYFVSILCCKRNYQFVVWHASSSYG